ncbi:hypothetical protein SAMN00768000_1759 [Sulfobacillus thermosulfidooxidans DSM 9293]|uniref:Uncharacterized protein n=1 Tax=Sulfobacillus thermosulfidooxidans (strain DSM 9293 / VKM B-1269 / AT-1) TaxID=929705 RepID=A0A1W1WEC3_SULTA|nr:hypothetical protein SAMN00768000_1759 [Sulfobacillus thermosulfidooxidans DSM 9293]
MRTPSLMTYFVGMFQIDQKKFGKALQDFTIRMPKLTKLKNEQYTPLREDVYESPNLPAHSNNYLWE